MQHTYCELQECKKELFEKLGCMVLATHEGNIDKVTIYLRSINHLIDSIDNRIKITEDRDCVTDLKILKEKVIYLQYFANATLTKAQNFKS
jgi:hypothetical protein